MPDAPDSTPAFQWIDEDAALGDLVASLSDEPRLGIDTEFHRERTYFPQCALVQIGWSGGRSALIDPLAVDIRAIGPLLTGRTVVMHAAGQDLEVFAHSVGVIPDNLFDTQVAASFLGMSSIGLAPLVAKLVGVTLPKADRLTDWLARPLPERAAVYAASDVEHLFTLHDQMVDQLEDRGRMGWVRHECEQFVARTIEPSVATRAWWRVKEARRLRGRAAAVAQEVGAWREAHARETDRPLRTVLPDLALAGIAQRPPRSVEELSKVRGLRDRGVPKGARAGLLEAVERGQELDLDAVDLPESRPVPAELRAALPLLMSWVSQRARLLDLDPAVLATRGDLEGFLRGDEDSRLASGWREEAVTAELDLLLRGHASLAFETGSGLVLRRTESDTD